MKCPKCGREISSGHLYGESCGTEISFVPEFDPEIENKIRDSLKGVAKNLKDENIFNTLNLSNPGNEKNSYKKYIPFYTAGIIVFVIVLISFIFMGNKSSTLSFHRKL